MLVLTSKLLSVQIITTTTLITVILLSSCYSTAKSLPITSKPIESTAENLAWEAWLMVPVGQQQKTRKVTPKSIFIVPQKKNQTIQCQPGEHLYESRCIPTVNIDTEKILLTQLTNIVIASGDYDYDYDEESIDATAPEKLEGDADLFRPSIGDNADEPLKFDIFRDNFPIGSSGSGDSSGNKDSEDESLFFIGERRRRPPTPLEKPLPDLDTGSTSYGTYSENADDNSKEDSALFLSEIDAILVPAVSETNGKEQSLNFSIYQEVANTTRVNSDVEILQPVAEKNVTIEQILVGEALFLDEDHELKKEITTTTERIETTNDLFETTTMKLEEKEDVESKTEFTRSVTEFIPVDEETTITSAEPTDTTEITSTFEAEVDSMTTIIPSEETTSITLTGDQDDITTISNSNKNDITTIRNPPDDISPTLTEPKPLPSDPFVFQQHSDNKSLPPVIDIKEEMKKINNLVAKKLKSSTTATPNVETSSNSSELWTKIIPSSSAITTTPVNPSISPTIGSSTPTSSSISRNSSSNSARVASSTDSQESVTDSSSSTLATPIAGSNPFWWLPNGWKVDRTDTDRPLLLRFWSALSGISGSQTKV